VRLVPSGRDDRTGSAGTSPGRTPTPDFDRVIEVVREVLATRGEAGLRIDELCHSAGVSRSSLYAEFGDRNGLIAAARLRQVRKNHEDAIGVIADAVEGAADARDYRQRVLALTELVHSEQRHLQRVLRASIVAGTLGQQHYEAALRREQTALTRRITDVVRGGQERGFIDPATDPHLLATLIQVLSFGTVIADFDDDMDAARRRDWIALVNQIYDAIAYGGTDGA